MKNHFNKHAWYRINSSNNKNGVRNSDIEKAIMLSAYNRVNLTRISIVENNITDFKEKADALLNKAKRLKTSPEDFNANSAIQHLLLESYAYNETPETCLMLGASYINKDRADFDLNFASYFLEKAKSGNYNPKGITDIHFAMLYSSPLVTYGDGSKFPYHDLKKAINSLESAARNGFNDYEFIQNSPLLTELRLKTNWPIEYRRIFSKNLNESFSDTLPINFTVVDYKKWPTDKKARFINRLNTHNRILLLFQILDGASFSYPPHNSISFRNNQVLLSDIKSNTDKIIGSFSLKDNLIQIVFDNPEYYKTTNMSIDSFEIQYDSGAINETYLLKSQNTILLELF